MRTRMMLCPSVPLRAQLCPPHRGAQAKSGGALFKKFRAGRDVPLTFETVSAPMHCIILSWLIKVNFLLYSCFNGYWRRGKYKPITTRLWELYLGHWACDGMSARTRRSTCWPRSIEQPLEPPLEPTVLRNVRQAWPPWPRHGLLNNSNY